MITSNRNFGVEIEFVTPTKRDLEKISNNLRVVHDGSLRPYPYAGEYVSGILSGKTGESEIEHVCSILKKNYADIDNTATSIHVHLDGKKSDNTLVKSKSPFNSLTRQIGISKAVLKDLSEKVITRMLILGIPDSHLYNVTFLNNINYLSKVELTRKPRINYVYFSLDSETRFKWLKNVFYFYTAYSKVMESIVSKSRRAGNSYCKPLSESFELSDIEACNNMEDLMNCWYKSGSRSDRYNNSRYHNVNLHSYFYSTGTVEIRSHGGTTDPNKILLWVKLHQFIVDKLEDLSFEDLKKLINSDDDIYKSFINFINDELLIGYIKRLLGYFSGITIK